MVSHPGEEGVLGDTDGTPKAGYREVFAVDQGVTLGLADIEIDADVFDGEVGLG